MSRFATSGLHTLRGVRRYGLSRMVRAAASLSLMVILASAPLAKPAAASSDYDTHQGVDRCSDQNQKQVADLWNNGTPFFNYGLYIGGAEGGLLGCTSTVAFSNYVKSVGFGIMPIWDDLQPPCTGNGAVMSSNATTARGQGVTSAHNAQAAMTRFGFTSTDNVWLDIEPFTETNASCRAAVHAYIDGWDSVLNVGADAGVYIHHANANSLATLAHVPNALWIAHYSAAVNTVWGFSDIPDGSWVLDQRIHQYRGSKLYGLPWGCTAGAKCPDGQIQVDVNCVNAWMDGGALNADPDSAEGGEANSPAGEPTCNGPAQ
jgi:hypothetical protein